MTDKEVMPQALEALEGVYLSLQLPDLLKVVEPITALREALAQPEQKPVAWMVKLGDVTCFQHHADSKHASVPLYTTAAQPEQVDCPRCGHVCSQRPWVGLTDDQIDEIAVIRRQSNQSRRLGNCGKPASQTKGTNMTEQEVNPCRFVDGACTHCEATERGDCQGWVSSPKREWQGLTDADVNRESAPITSQMKLAFHAGMYVAQILLYERYTFMIMKLLIFWIFLFF